MKLQDLPNSSTYDAMTLLCGDRIGDGVSRDVWSNPLNKNWVTKLETTIARFANHQEWIVWNAVKNVQELHKWFAPCHFISESGNWLIQERTAPVTLQELQRKVPRVPKLFTDLKVGNWGRLGNRIVCHDYGTAMTTECGITMSMKKADWWDL